MSITAPNYVQGQYSVADRDRIFAKADKYPDASGGITNQVPTLAADGSIIWRQQSSGGGDGTANANIAVVEDTSTASQAYSVGDLLVYSGQLYRVTAAIAQGDTITPGTNVTPTTVANELDSSVAGVSSFNGRTGAVTPQAADYPPSLIGAAAASDIAQAEESPATAAHAENSFLIYNGQLYRVTSPISIGDALTVGTNIAAADVGTYLAMVAAAPNAGGFAPSGYGLGIKANALTAISDTESIEETGWYLAVNGTTAHLPLAVAGIIRAEAYSANNVALTFYYNDGVNSAICLRRKISGTWGAWEWDNPPLIAGQEYRTTERFNGKPVYVKRLSKSSTDFSPSLDFTTIANYSVAHGISNLGRIVSVEGSYTAPSVWGAYANAVIPFCWIDGGAVKEKVSCHANSTYAIVSVEAGNSAWSGATSIDLIIKYTKSTD